MRAPALLVSLVVALGCNGLSELDYTSIVSRDGWQRPGDVVAVLEIQPGDRVADLGAGKGYFVAHLSEAVGPDGVVFAVEVEQELVDGLGERFPAESSNVEPVLALTDDPRLPDGSVDLVLIVNTYHHIEDRGAYFQRLRLDLAPGGRVAVIEPNEDLGGLLSLTLDEGHKSSAPAVQEEMQRAGYRLETQHDFLPVQIFSVFTPEPGAS